MFLVQSFHQLHQPFMADGCLNAGQFVQLIPSYLISSFLQWKSSVLLNMGWVWEKDNDLDTGRNVDCIYYLFTFYHLWFSYVFVVFHIFFIWFTDSKKQIWVYYVSFKINIICNFSQAISFRAIGKDSLTKAWKKLVRQPMKTWKKPIILY